jgi:hypothetical protein
VPQSRCNEPSSLSQLHLGIAISIFLLGKYDMLARETGSGEGVCERICKGDGAIGILFAGDCIGDLFIIRIFVG